MRQSLGIGLLGCGVVGAGVARVLLEESDRLASRAGRRLDLRRVVVRDPGKDRGVELPPGLLSTSLEDVLADDSVDVVVELAGGTDWARQAVLRSLAAGKDVVTANKALLAEHGREIFDAARRHDRAIAFEASVAGGIPIIAALTQSLAANQITMIQGILNGTCNFILTAMTERGASYADVLREAQTLGYAEADPTLDVNGTDAAHKLAILAQLAFGITVPVESIPKHGIARIEAIDILFARELGYVIKLLAEAYLSEDRLALHVSPVLLRKHDPLAQVRGPYNAIKVVGDLLGDTLYYGRGAGQSPTASAVLADLLDLAVSRETRVLHTRRLWNAQAGGVALRDPQTVRSRYYLRLLVQDRPGVLAEVAGVLAEHHVSIASVIQHEAPEEKEGQWVHLVIMTHTAQAGAFRASASAMEHLGCVATPAVYYPVGD
jgi:homoserine dehydrogenase